MTNFSLFPPPLFFLLLLSFSTASNLINQTCKESSKADPNINYTFCSTALKSAAAGGAANLTRLGLISMSLLKRNCTTTKSLIRTLLKGGEVVDKSTKSALEDCSELYSDAVLSVMEATRDYKSKRFGDANVKVSSIVDASTTCEQGFQDLGVVSPLSEENDQVFQLCAIALSIINMLSFDRLGHV